jgi:hypothetical protein
MNGSKRSGSCLLWVLWATILWSILPVTLLAQYPNILVSAPGSTNPNEVTIAINPANPLHLAGGANLRYVYRSTDGGWTWTEGLMSSSLGVWGDPCVAYDADGALYYGHLSNPPAPGYWIDRIIVQKSTDDGESWNDGVGVGFVSPREQDKEWITVDQTQSPYRNNIYMAWTEFDNYGSITPGDSSRILFSRSVDGGMTFSSPIRVSDVGGDCLDDDNTVEGAVPAVGPNGEVYLSWSGPLGIAFDKSTDGGTTWGVDKVIADQPGGWAFEVSGIYRCNGFPVTACDVSQGPYRGSVYVLWSDQRNGVEDTDVFIIKSTNRGSSWSSPMRVNNDVSNRQQFFPWLSVDPITGKLYVIFYDRRNTTGDATDVAVARSADGGNTWENFIVSDSSFVPTSSIFFGDYSNIAARGGMAYPMWTRIDGSARSTWIAIVADTVTSVAQGASDVPTSLALAQNYPNPFNGESLIRYSIPSAGFVTLELFNVLGEAVRTLQSRWESAGDYTVRVWMGDLPGGVYFCRLSHGGSQVSRRMVFLK